MNILMLAPLPPPSGGIASWTVRFKEYCENHGIGLRIVNIAMIGERANREVMKRSIITELKRTNKIVKDLRRELKHENPNIVHINSSCSSLGVLRDAICAFVVHNKIPIVLHCRCNIEDQIGIRAISIKAFRYLVHKSCWVIVLNKFSKEYVDAIVAGKSVIIPNFVDKNMIVGEHCIKENVNTVVYVGHIERDKGIVQIIEAAKLLPQIQFKLVGAIREDISKIGFSPNIHFVGRVPLEGVREYLKEADIFLFPSISEGFSNALLEAMAMGVPVIATNVGANADMIEDGGGIILKENTGDEIYIAINNMKDFKIRKSMSDWNINKVKKSYMIESVMKNYMDIYNQASTL